MTSALNTFRIHAASISIEVEAENPDAARKAFKDRYPDLLVTKVKRLNAPSQEAVR